MNKHISFLLVLALISMGCDNENNGDDSSIIRDSVGKIVSGTVKQYDNNDVLHSIREVKNYKLDGKSLIFQKDGKTLKSEVYYKEGKKHGIVKAYYTNGKLYRTYNYSNGLMEGEQKRFRENGQVSSIAFYKEGQPNNTLQEFLINGDLKKKYPKIIVNTDDKMLLTGLYKIRVSMSNKTKRVQYYLGKLDKDGFIRKDAVRMGSKGSGFFEITYNVGKDQFVIEKLDIIAKVKTKQGNYYITTRPYNVAIENRM